MSTSRYIILGNIAQGANPKFTGTLQTIQRTFDAKAIHIGPLLTRVERQVYSRSVDMAKIWTKIFEQKKEWSDRDENLLEARIELLADKFNHIEEAQDDRISFLQNTFGDVGFVIHDYQKVNSRLTPKATGRKELCAFLDLDPTEPSGEGVNQQPITNRVLQYLTQWKKSAILPHGVGVCVPVHAAGPNNVNHYWTTGQLKSQEDLIGGAFRLPRALMVVVDNKTGRYFLSPLRMEKDGSVLLDGLRFTAKEKIDERYHVVVGDEHAEAPCLPVVASMQELAEATECLSSVYAGDSVSCCAINPHVGATNIERRGRTLEDDANVLALLARLVRNPVFLVGNHERWFYRFRDDHPECGALLEDLFFRATRDNTDTVVVRPSQDASSVFKIGDMTIRHGDMENLAQAGRLFGKALLHHLHSHAEYLNAIQQGMGGMVAPSYIHGAMTGWINTVTVVTETKKGIANADVKFIWHKGREYSYCFRGEVRRGTVSQELVDAFKLAGSDVSLWE